ncbi:hypothetical protein ACL02U_06250 [Streptomyces sp. MS06]|uniref:hypothetical protein n=1 Tax=Streptomyces sp. MS06 TaxID=3385974 RepID=UPI0039A3D832
MSDANRRALRTLVQTTLALAALLPTIVDTAGLPRTLPYLGGCLAVAAGLSRVMSLPSVQRLLPGWLRADAAPNGDSALLSLASAEAEREEG